MPTSSDDIAFINDIINYNKIWYPSNIEDFNLSNKEYISYMDTAKTPYYVIELNKSHKSAIVFRSPKQPKLFRNNQV